MAASNQSTTQVASTDGDEKEKPITPAATRDESYSNLEHDWTKDQSAPEVDTRRNFSDLEVVRQGHSNLEVSPGYGRAEGIQSGNLQAYHPGVVGLGESQGPMPVYQGLGKDSEGPIVVENKVEKSGGRRTILGLRRRYFWVAVAVVVLIVIGGVVGGVVGSNHAQSSSESASNSTSGSSDVPGSGSPTTAGTLSPTATPLNTGIKRGSNLNALAWTVSETRYQYRVYYQDDDNAIKESGYDSSTGSWRVTTILDGSGVLPGTSIATTSSKQSASDSDTVSINLYYLDNALDIRVISFQNGAWNPDPSTSAGTPDGKNIYGKLSAYFLECELCPNTMLVAYASDGVVTLYNHTSSEAWEGSTFTLVDESVLNGTSISFQPYSVQGYADQLNLYYQRSDDSLLLTSWFSTDYQRDHNLDLSSSNGWQAGGINGVVGTISSNSSIATLYFGDDEGSPAHVQAITSGWNGTDYSGLQVYDWTNNAWANPVGPDLLQSVSGASAIAAHFYQRVYAASDGILTQYAVADDGTTWTVIGNVPTL